MVPFVSAPLLGAIKGFTGQGDSVQWCVYQGGDIYFTRVKGSIGRDCRGLSGHEMASNQSCRCMQKRKYSHCSLYLTTV